MSIMDDQDSLDGTLETLELNDHTKSEQQRRKSNDSYNYNESNLDLFSHDSTHVRLVIEAEKQTSLARERASQILQKLSMEVGEHDKETALILSKLSMDVALPEKDSIDSDHERNINESAEARDESNYNDYKGVNFDNIRMSVENDDSSSPSVNKSNNDTKVFELMDTPNEDDIAHLKQCILPLSPSGAPKGKGKRISGQFEFKRMNSVLTVVKSFEDSSVDSAKSKTSRSSRFSLRRKGSMRSNRTSKSLNSFNESNALTDDAFLQEIYDDEIKKQKKKEKRSGDLPPRLRKRSIIGSMGSSAAGDAEREDVISVVSNLSELSLESIGFKVKKSNNGPIVVTEESLRPPRIPDVLCLKTQIKLSRMTKLKRKMSFNRGKASF